MTSTEKNDGRVSAEIKIGDIIEEQWKVHRMLGEGSCGTVWLLKNVNNKKVHAAMKVEPFMKSHDDEILRMEVFVLKKMQKSEFVCRLIGAGKVKNYSYLIMSLLGRNIGDLRAVMPTKRFTTGTTLRLGLHGLQALSDLHTVGFLHRDIKPLNFSMGATIETKKRMFLFDFGLARQILLPVQGTNELKLREPRKKVVFRGTVRYCSGNVHKHKEQGRHDDLISLLYMLVEMITGELPWRGLNRKESAKKKDQASDDELFHHCPTNFSAMYSYLRGLDYDDDPNYDMIKDAFMATLELKKYRISALIFILIVREPRVNLDAPYDWEKGGRYFEKIAGKALIAKGKAARADDEKVEKDEDNTSTVSSEAPSTIDQSDEANSNSSVDDIEKENTLEDLDKIA